MEDGVASSLDASLDAKRVFRVATTNRAAKESSVHVLPTEPSRVTTGRLEWAEGVLQAASTGAMPLDPRKKAQAAEEGSVGVSAVARLRWERWNQSRAVSVWTTIVEDEMRTATGLGTNQQTNKTKIKCCVLSVVAISIEGDNSRGDSHSVWDGGAKNYSTGHLS